MKSGTLVAAVLLALVAGNLAAGNSMAGEISKGSLAKMGLAGVQKMSDREGKQVRGSGAFAISGSFGFTIVGGVIQFVPTSSISSHTMTSAFSSTSSSVSVH